MATRYEIHTKQKFTDWGTIGVYLFLLSPVATGLGLVWLDSQMNSYRPNVIAPSLLLFAAGMGFMVGVVLMLIGRAQIHNVYQSEVADTKLESATRDIGYR